MACCQAWLARAGDNLDAVVFDNWRHADPSSRSLMAFTAGRRQEQRRISPREVLVFRPFENLIDLAKMPAQRQSGHDTTHVVLEPLTSQACQASCGNFPAWRTRHCLPRA